jgi:hypothetical protein
MTTRHPLPGGQWAELLDPDELTGADQDAFLDKYDELIEAVPQPEPQPDPANPAVMLAAPPRQLGTAGNRALRDWILTRVITGWSLNLPLPYTGQYREVLPVRVCNALAKAIKPLQGALTDSEEEDEDAGAPKSAVASGTGGSEGTSEAGTPSLLPAPPAVLSGTL